MRTTISWRADCGHCMLFENLIYSLLFTLATLYRRDTSYRNYRVNFYMQTMSTSTRLNLVTVARANPSQNECMYILKIELFMLIWIIYCCFQSFCINANTKTTARSDCIDYFYQHFYLIKAVSEREREYEKKHKSKLIFYLIEIACARYFHVTRFSHDIVVFARQFTIQKGERTKRT